MGLTWVGLYVSGVICGRQNTSVKWVGLSASGLTLITKKFGRKNNSDKRVSENLTVRNFRRPKFFTSEIFPELFHRENENNVYLALTIWRFFTTKSIFLLLLFFFLLDEIWTWLFQQLIIFPIHSFLCVSGPHLHIFCPNFAGFGYNCLRFCPKFCPKLSEICWKTVRIFRVRLFRVRNFYVRTFL